MTNGPTLPLPSGENTGALPLAILLQGPVGPFFQALAAGLRQRRFRVLKINFNMGDLLFSHGPGTLMFRDTPERWEAWFRNFLDGNRPACVILFGDQRLYHRTAVAACKHFGIDVWCMDEGYLRPEYITFQSGGTNAASLPWAADEPAGVVATPVRITGRAFAPMAWAATFYYIAKSFDGFLVGNYVHHRRRSLASETFFWNRNAFRKWRRRHANAQAMLDLLEHCDNRYFVVALQVHDDLNVTAHGNGWSMEMLIDAAIGSFARHARPDDLLVIKAHPLDRGHRNYNGLVAELSVLAGVASRIRLLDDGPMGLLVRHARGVLVINSTSGLLALKLGCPVFVLGEAIFKRDGLVQSGGIAALDKFWSNPVKPAEALRERFLNELIARTQINGSFYQSQYFEMTINAIAQKLEQRLENERVHAGARLPG